MNIIKIEEYVKQRKLKPSSCTLGCGKMVIGQIIEYRLHQCILSDCVTWKTKCRICKGMLGPTGNILHGKIAIYQEWDTHDRMVKRLKEQDVFNQDNYNQDDK